MSAIVTPLHIEALGLANIRFFAPPSGGREFPWLSIDDLHASLVLPRQLRQHFKSEFHHSPFAADAKMVATADGLTTIVPHYVAQGLIDAMREVGHVDADFYASYARAGAAALRKITVGLSPTDLLIYIGAAHQASNSTGARR